MSNIVERITAASSFQQGRAIQESRTKETSGTSRVMKFPKAIRHKDFRMYAASILNSAKFAGIDIVYESGRISPVTGLVFITLNGIDAIIDYADGLTTRCPDVTTPVFRFNYTPLAPNPRNTYAFVPLTFYDWNSFNQMRESLPKKRNTTQIIATQRIFPPRLLWDDYFDTVGVAAQLPIRRPAACGLNNHPREYVRGILEPHIGKRFIWKRESRDVFLQQLVDHLFTFHVPGTRFGILDRTVSEHMAFGGCAISSQILTELPYGQKLIPGVHYVQCADDFSDVLEVTDWCLQNVDKCVAIGQNAMKLFDATYRPAKVWDWVYNMITNDDTESDARRVFNTRLAKVRADRINMQQNVEELFSAFMEMWKIHPSRFMEIGSLNGGSLYILAGACAPGAVIACFDIKRVTKRQAILDDLRREGFLTYEQIGDSGSMQTLDRFKKMFPRGLDALHIDGDHGKPNCFLDFEWYGTSVRNGGLVLIHDIATKFECAEAWLELRHRYRHAEYKNGGQGMGVLFV